MWYTISAKSACCLLAVAAALAAKAQPFQNLGFEEANTNSTTFFERIAVDGVTRVVYGIGPTEDLLPGWQLFEGSKLVTRIGINSALVLAGANINLYTPANGGKYALDLGFNAEDAPWSLVQRGDVPSNARYLSFSTGFGGAAMQAPRITLDGKDLSIVRGLPASFGTNRLVYDVSAFAGQNAELRFIYDINASYRTVDDIFFFGLEPFRFKIERSGQTLVLSWLGGGTLTSSRTIDGEFTPMINGTTTPYVVALEGTMRFYRVEN